MKWFLLALFGVLISCSNDPVVKEDIRSEKETGSNSSEVIPNRDEADSLSENLTSSERASLPASLSELGEIPHGNYNAAFKYLNNITSSLDNIDWEEFSAVANYLLAQRNFFINRGKLGDFTVAGKISDVLTQDLARRVVHSEVTTNQARNLLNRYSGRAYNVEKLSQALEAEYTENIDLQASAMDRYKALNQYATNASGTDEELFSHQGDTFSEAWFIESKRSIISLLHIYESQKRSFALEALLKYIERGGDLKLNSSDFRESAYRLVPEDFEKGKLLEFNGTGNLNRLHPSDVYLLISSNQ